MQNSSISAFIQLMRLAGTAEAPPIMYVPTEEDFAKDRHSLPSDTQNWPAAGGRA